MNRSQAGPFGIRTVAAFLSMCVAAAQTPPPDTIYFNGNIYTVNPEQPRAESLAVAGDRIIAIGSNAACQKLLQPHTRRVNLAGKTVLPGLIDAHGHLLGLGAFGLGRLDLSSAKSFDEVIAIVVERAGSLPAGEWIVGGRWDHENWPDRMLPNHAALSAATPDHPVWLTRVDGHAGIANAAAMRAAGVTRETAAPSGGEILRDSSGEPTGVFIDAAENLIARHAKGGGADVAELMLKAQEMCLSVGLTGVHDPGVSPAEVEVYQKLADERRLKLRVYVMMNGSAAMTYFKEHPPRSDARLSVRACKLYADGALGSRGAWLLESYADRPVDDDGRAYTGLNVMKPEFVRMVAEDALERGYQVCTHAIGDRGNRMVLDAYAIALSRRPRADHRFRIEHAQVLHPEDIPRFAEIGVIPSMQPTHCTSDMRWVEARVGAKRAAGTHAWASLLRTGAWIAAGSDFPVESHNPFLGFYAAITRQHADGRPHGGWFGEQRMTREEILRAFTLHAAYAAFEEKDKGSLAPGKFADFIVIDRDVMTCDAGDILETRVLRTVIGGETVYEAERASK